MNRLAAGQAISQGQNSLNSTVTLISCVPNAFGNRSKITEQILYISMTKDGQTETSIPDTIKKLARRMAYASVQEQQQTRDQFLK